MITEYVLLLLASIVMVTFVLTGGPNANGGIQGIFTQGIPQLAIRMEKHLITGYPFCVQYPSQRNGGTGAGCDWNFQ